MKNIIKMFALPKKETIKKIFVIGLAVFTIGSIIGGIIYYQVNQDFRSWIIVKQAESKIEAAKEQVKRKPMDSNAHLKLGIAYFSYYTQYPYDGDFNFITKATSEFNMAIDLDKNNAQAYIWKSKIDLYMLSHLILPQSVYNKILQYQNEGAASYELVQSLANSQNYPYVAKRVRELQGKPWLNSTGILYTILGNSLIGDDKSSWQNIYNNLDAALKLKPQDSEAHRLFGNYYAGNPKPWEIYQTAGERKPTSQELQDRVRKEYKLAIQYDKNNYAAYSDLALYYLENNDKNEALKVYEQLKQVNRSEANKLFKEMYQ